MERSRRNGGWRGGVSVEVKGAYEERKVRREGTGEGAAGDGGTELQ